MKFKPLAEIKDLEGNIFKKDKDTNAVLADFAMTALLAERPNEQVPPEKKFHRYNVASRIKNAVAEKAEFIDLPSEDIALIKDQIGKYYGPGVMGPAWRAIESN